MIQRNRIGLQKLASFSVDHSFLQDLGMFIFNFTGEADDVYKQKCSEMSLLLTDMKAALDDVGTEIPVFKGE